MCTSSASSPPAEQPDDGKDDPLLVDLAERSDAGGRPAPHVDVMAAVGHVADQFAPVEEGGDEEDIVEVAGLAVRIVDQQGVARTERRASVFVRVLRHRPGDEPTDGHQVRGLAERLRHHAAGRVDEGARIVQPCLDVGRIRRPLQRDGHLLRRLDERVPDDLEQHRVHGPALTRRHVDLTWRHVDLPLESRGAFQPTG